MLISSSTSELLVDAVQSAIQAGNAIIEIYHTDFSVETKSDRSPLTLADAKSHQVITESLGQHGIPIISEEGGDIPIGKRSRWQSLLMVDPLDGTKEFVKRNGEFTVNIALIEDQRPVMGVVYAPVKQWLYFSEESIGAYKLDHFSSHTAIDFNCSTPEEQLKNLMQKGNKLPLKQPDRRPYTIVGSRSHSTPELEEFVACKSKEKESVKFIAAGSSLKICLVAEGAADVYPRLGPTMEWDSAAGQAIAECAGATVHIYQSTQPLRYNKDNLLNPWFIVER